MNGPPDSLGVGKGMTCSKIDPILPDLHQTPFNITVGHEKILPSDNSNNASLRQIYVKQGPKAFAQAVRNHKGEECEVNCN